jgi:hypothetical protein
MPRKKEKARAVHKGPSGVAHRDALVLLRPDLYRRGRADQVARRKYRGPSDDAA